MQTGEEKELDEHADPPGAGAGVVLAGRGSQYVGETPGGAAGEKESGERKYPGAVQAPGSGVI